MGPPGQLFPFQDPRPLRRSARSLALSLALAALTASTARADRAPPRIGPGPGRAVEVSGGGRATGKASPCIRRVIVDPGHGGRDAGAVGPSRVEEKDVTLGIARRLARRLRKRGYSVVLTRRDDRYVSLDERTSIANARRGDLFVSVHANASPKRGRRGIETFVRSWPRRGGALRVARRTSSARSRSGSSPRGLRCVPRRTEGARARASHRLGALVQHHVRSRIRALALGVARDRGVKTASLFVLEGARMPAVLVEAGFISNRAEERRLASSRSQEAVAAGITRAIVDFGRGARGAPPR